MSTKVYEFLIDAFGKMNYDVSDVTPDTALGAAGLDLESLAVADVAIQIEDTFGVKFDEDEAERLAMMTVGDLANEVSTRAAAASA